MGERDDAAAYVHFDNSHNLYEENSPVSSNLAMIMIRRRISAAIRILNSIIVTVVIM